MLYNAVMISIFFGFFAALLLQKDSAWIEEGQVRSLLSMRGMLLGYSFEPRPNSLSSYGHPSYQLMDARTRKNQFDKREQDWLV